MKKLMMPITAAGLIAGCATHTESGQGGGGSETSGSMGTNPNSSAPSSQGGTGTGTQQGGTTDQSTPRPNQQPQ
jgi:hypothetical protein